MKAPIHTSLSNPNWVINHLPKRKCRLFQVKTLKSWHLKIDLGCVFKNAYIYIYFFQISSGSWLIIGGSYSYWKCRLLLQGADSNDAWRNLSQPAWPYDPTGMAGYPYGTRYLAFYHSLFLFSLSVRVLRVHIPCEIYVFFNCWYRIDVVFLGFILSPATRLIF